MKIGAVTRLKGYGPKFSGISPRSSPEPKGGAVGIPREFINFVCIGYMPWFFRNHTY